MCYLRDRVVSSCFIVYFFFVRRVRVVGVLVLCLVGCDYVIKFWLIECV